MSTHVPAAARPLLPPKSDLETRAVLRLAPAHRYLAELKGLASTIPNEHILINTRAAGGEGQPEIENIITTQDDLYKADLFSDYIRDPACERGEPLRHRAQEGF